MPTANRDDTSLLSTLAIVLLIMAAVTTWYVWQSVERFERYVECQAAWGDRMVQYEIAADAATRRERAVTDFEARILNRLVEDLIDPEVDDDEAAQRWQQAHADAEQRREELEAEREDNPPPEPPLEVCGTSAGPD